MIFPVTFYRFNPPSGYCAARPRYLDEPPQPLLPGVSSGFSPSFWSLTASFLAPFFTFFVFLTSFFSTVSSDFSVTSVLSLGALPAPDLPPQPLAAAKSGAEMVTPATKPAMPIPATRLFIVLLSMLSPPFQCELNNLEIHFTDKFSLINLKIK